MTAKNYSHITVTVYFDRQDRANEGWAYRAEYADCSGDEGAGGLLAEDEAAALAEAQAMYPGAQVDAA